MKWDRTKLVGLVGASTLSALLVIVPKFEGTIDHGYRDPIGIVTACTGHTATAKLGRRYSPEECAQLLIQDLGDHAKGVMACVHVPMTTGQRAAFISFGFNVGVQKFCDSTMAEKANAGDMVGACAELSRWVRAGGKVMNGLVERRKAERALCEGRTG